MREEIELARRAVASPHWRWMPGMLTDVGERVTDPAVCYLGTLPDLTDPATLGCVLALVRDAWGWPHAYAERAALVAALETAPVGGGS
jgi:hypothetical protein